VLVGILIDDQRTTIGYLQPSGANDVVLHIKRGTTA
jgi:hypothetical protein